MGLHSSMSIRLNFTQQKNLLPDGKRFPEKRKASLRRYLHPHPGNTLRIGAGLLA